MLQSLNHLYVPFLNSLQDVLPFLYWGAQHKSHWTQHFWCWGGAGGRRRITFFNLPNASQEAVGILCCQNTLLAPGPLVHQDLHFSVDMLSIQLLPAWTGATRCRTFLPLNLMRFLMAHLSIEGWEIWENLNTDNLYKYKITHIIKIYLRLKIIWV